MTLRAYHAGGYIVLQLTDDGAGLDRARLVSKAIAKKLIVSDLGMSDSDVYNVIFEPGFSMKEQVTDVSGRGVGMDVVRRCITSLSGRVEISSELGKGTTFTVRLPLTLAITDGMLARVPRAPLHVRGVINLRGKIVPVADLRVKFEMATSDGRELCIVVVRTHGHDMGVVVAAVPDRGLAGRRQDRQELVRAVRRRPGVRRERRRRGRQELVQDRLAENGIARVMNAYVDLYDMYYPTIFVDTTGRVVAVNSTDEGGRPIDTKAIYAKSYKDAPRFRAVSGGTFTTRQPSALAENNVATGTFVEDAGIDEDVRSVYRDYGTAIGFSAPVKNSAGKVIGYFRAAYALGAVKGRILVTVVGGACMKTAIQGGEDLFQIGRRNITDKRLVGARPRGRSRWRWRTVRFV